ncbi:hypothetical protein ACFE04_008759 [Oxalis oulophora]
MVVVVGGAAGVGEWGGSRRKRRRFTVEEKLKVTLQFAVNSSIAHLFYSTLFSAVESEMLVLSSFWTSTSTLPSARANRSLHARLLTIGLSLAVSSQFSPGIVAGRQF